MKAEITLDMDRRCTDCGTQGTGANGLCLRCGMRRSVGLRPVDRIMRKKEEAKVTQLSLTTELVELTDAERIAAGVALAEANRRLELLDEEHTERRKEMRDERQALVREISYRGDIVRTGREERPVAR